jgi:hypothetical protein
MMEGVLVREQTYRRSEESLMVSKMGQTLWKKKTTMKHNECLGKIRWPQIQ